jgi:hypothetical protein
MEVLTRDGFVASDIARRRWGVPILIENSASRLIVKEMQLVQVLSFFRDSLLISSSILRSRPVISSVYCV